MTQPSDIAAEFAKLEARRHELEQQCAERASRLFHGQKALASVRSAIKEDEATIWANGGAGKVTIDGKNEKLREAQFVLASQEVPTLVASNSMLGEIEANIESTERELANLRLVIRGIDHSMAMKIEQMTFMNTPRYYRSLEGT